MESRNAVYAVRACNGHVSHSDNAVGNNSHALNLICIACCIPNIAAEAVVDFLCDFVNSRKKSLEEILRPTLKRLGHNGVVGISDGIGYNVPCFVPAVAAVIEKNSHQLGDCKGRVGVVDVNCDFIGEIVNSAVNSQMSVDDILN